MQEPPPISEFQGEVALPFALERVEGADCLVVGFPAYRTGTTAPPLWLGAQIESVRAHRLYLGSDEYSFVGPRQEALGLETATRLVAETADELAVPPRRVACVGTSMAATLAALTGLRMGAGLCVLGGPPIWVGSHLQRWAQHERREGTQRPVPSAARFLELASREGGEDAVSWLDGLIVRFARACSRPMRLRLFTSETDFTYPGVERLVELSDEFPNVAVGVELTDAPDHGTVSNLFYTDFLPRTLGEELGLQLA